VQDSTIGQQGRKLGLQQAKLANHSVQLKALQSQNDQQEGELDDLFNYVLAQREYNFFVV
jgi:hypothetical protein